MTPRTALLLVAASCATPSASPDGAAGRPRPTADEAQAFVKKADETLRKLSVRSATAEWIKNTHITDDTERNAAAANEDLLAWVTSAIQQAARYDGLQLPADVRRQIHLLKLSAGLPAPDDARKRGELTALSAKLEGMYGKGKYCKAENDCKDLQALEKILKTSRNEPELREAWLGWHKISVEMRPLYRRLVELGNEGARELGFKDVGSIWRGGYDMPAEEIARETDRLWGQVKPLYDALHCHVRARLADKHGAEVVKPGEPIPAHLLGNMWAQSWDHVYPLVEPYPGAVNLDVEKGLRKGGYDAIKMAKLAESFFTSLGLDALPKTFWERSLFVKPRDREVVCHASAWDVTSDGDLRIKMCIQPTEEDLQTLHHELGHDYYFMYYHKLPILFQAGANDGFHEAIGDAIQHSINPAYLKQVGLLDGLPKDEKGLVNVQMKEALAKVAFLPFGKLIDQWRWRVFDGTTPPERYNAAWWELKRTLQGVKPPAERSEADFDPGAKYHIPASVPYLRYFIAHILQYQFHRALCRVAGHQGPLHQCSIYGNKAAGERLRAMLAMGASRPWQDALEAFSGERAMDASAVLEYFAPLKKWLDEQNTSRTCGW